MFRDVPDKISRDRLEQIIKVLDPKDKEEVIKGLMRFAIYLVNKVSKQRSYDEDILCEGLLALSETVEEVFEHRYPVIDIDHFIRYVAKSVTYKCHRAAQRIKPISKSWRTIRYQRANGINGKVLSKAVIADYEISQAAKDLLIKLPVRYQDGLLEDAKNLPVEEFGCKVWSVLEQLIASPSVKSIKEDYPDEGEEVGGYIVPIAKEELGSEVTEILQKSIMYPLEGAIIKLRAEGYTYKEIGPQVGLSHMAVCNCVNDVAERFYALYEITKPIKERVPRKLASKPQDG